VHPWTYSSQMFMTRGNLLLKKTLWPSRAQCLQLACPLSSCTSSRLLQKSLLQCHAYHCRVCGAARRTRACIHTHPHPHTHARTHIHTCTHACTRCTDSADGLCQLFSVASVAPPHVFVSNLIFYFCAHIQSLYLLKFALERQ
jgi:hypothetical protein